MLGVLEKLFQGLPSHFGIALKFFDSFFSHPNNSLGKLQFFVENGYSFCFIFASVFLSFKVEDFIAVNNCFLNATLSIYF